MALDETVVSRLAQRFAYYLAIEFQWADVDLRTGSQTFRRLLEEPKVMSLGIGCRRFFEAERVSVGLSNSRTKALADTLHRLARRLIQEREHESNRLKDALFNNYETCFTEADRQVDGAGNRAKHLLGTALYPIKDERRTEIIGINPQAILASISLFDPYKLLTDLQRLMRVSELLRETDFNTLALGQSIHHSLAVVAHLFLSSNPTAEALSKEAHRWLEHGFDGERSRSRCVPYTVTQPRRRR